MLLLPVPAILALRWIDPPVTAFMLQSPVPVDHEWVRLDEISPYMAVAAVAAEDQKFPDHWGFDVASMHDALRERRDGGRLRGASTISQQVAKNLFLWPGKSFVRKGIEAYLTLWIEVLWPKERILEVYLNIAQFGEGTYGVAAASDRFFDARPGLLGPREAALLAAVLPNPGQLQVDQPSDYVRERRDWILGQMRQLGGITFLSDL